MQMGDRGTRKELEYDEVQTPAATLRDEQIAALLQTVERTEAAAKRAEAAAAAAMGKSTDHELHESLSRLTAMVIELEKRFEKNEKKKEDNAMESPKAPSKRHMAKARTTRKEDDDAADDESADEDDMLHEEFGAARITEFCRAIEFSKTDPDLIDQKKDIFGVESLYGRLKEKRPLLLSALDKVSTKRGAELKTVANALYKDLEAGIQPAPSEEAVVGVAVVALHNKCGEATRKVIQNAICALSDCESVAAVRILMKKCKNKKRIPPSLMHTKPIAGSVGISALREEIESGQSDLIRTMWHFYVVVSAISQDPNTAQSLRALKGKWGNLQKTNTEEALYEEHKLYMRGCRLKKSDVFCTIEDRVENFLSSRSAALHEAFYDQLEIDKTDVLDLTWDEIWDRLLDADAAVHRTRPQHKKRTHNEDKDNGSGRDRYCKLHGWGNHTTEDCGQANQYDNLDTVEECRKKGICFKFVSGKCRLSPEDCKFSHDLNNLPTPVEPPRTHNAPPPPLPQVVMPAVQKMDEEPNPDDIPVPTSN